MLVIIDYGMGNLHSVQKAIRRIGVESKVAVTAADVESATKLILPGVGHFKNGISRLREKGLVDLLNKKVIDQKVPILGICLGMQLFTNHSEEGDVKGFGWINAQTVKFDMKATSGSWKIPHMGWNNLKIEKQRPVYDGVTGIDALYFVHSYFVQCNDAKDILSRTTYGQEFVSSFQKDNIIGMQFHPEKSHGTGLKILTNFCKGN
ncbi:MAG: imidazole glycerol phosphate synthase subunit HisH [Bacteroidetes bacterium]|nr:MAG: imidazole glycerol phosphate synthase subunit HisH [Bacteroidota bacterium]